MHAQSPFEMNIQEQPAALRALLASDASDALNELVARPWQRIVLTGMGSSHFAGLPTWRALVSRGFAAWHIDASLLLESPGVLTPNTLLIATSQSGASGEVVELLGRTEGNGRPGGIIGIAADPESPLAIASDLFLPLLSGDEATVSSKSYLNSLALHRRLTAAFLSEDPAGIDEQILAAATAIEPLLSLDTSEIAQAALTPARPRLATIGWGHESTTAQYASLIIKESSKLPIEGFAGGAFRHGPYELAGPGLTAFIFVSAAALNTPAAKIASDLVASGSTVVVVGPLTIEGATRIPTSGGDSLITISEQSVVAESLAVSLSRANGVVPGAFVYGSKVTAKL